MTTWIRRGLEKIGALRESEPVRFYVTSYLGLVLASLVAQGTITDEISTWITGTVALVLGIPLAELARKRVTPVAKVADIAELAQDVGRSLVAADADPSSATTLDPVARGAAQALEGAAEALADNYIGRHRKAE